MEQFDSMLSPIIDQTLGQRCRSIIGYQYSEIIRSLMSVYWIERSQKATCSGVKKPLISEWNVPLISEWNVPYTMIWNVPL